VGIVGDTAFAAFGRIAGRNETGWSLTAVEGTACISHGEEMT